MKYKYNTDGDHYYKHTDFSRANLSFHPQTFKLPLILELNFYC